MIEEIIIQLHSMGAIKLGGISPKKELPSPFQVDFSGVLTTPQLAKEICGILAEKAKNISFDLLCGTGPIASHFASYIAWENELPFLGLKCEGTARVVGSYKSGQSCLLLHDVLASGSVVLDAVSDLENEGLEVRDILCFFDLCQGGKQKIKGQSYISHSIIGIADALQILFDSGKVAGDSFKLASDFLENG